MHPGDKNWDKFVFNDNKPYPFGDEAVTHAEAQALAVAKRIEEQGGPPADQLADKQVVALIAYLQRLGTDLTRSPDAAPEVEEAPADGVDESAPAEAAATATPTTLGSTNGGR